MLKALGKNIIIQAVKEEKKDGLLIIPNEKENYFWKVISVGEDVKNIVEGDNIYALYTSPIAGCEGYHIVNLDNVAAKK